MFLAGVLGDVLDLDWVAGWADWFRFWAPDIWRGDLIYFMDSKCNLCPLIEVLLHPAVQQNAEVEFSWAKHLHLKSAEAILGVQPRVSGVWTIISSGAFG
jgi:hypothetical protein